MHYHQSYGVTEGSLGLPCTDRQAYQLEDVLKDLRDPEPVRIVSKALPEFLLGERADVSWVSTEDPDRSRDIVLPSGMDDSHFKLNPLVTLQHAFWLPPVGRCIIEEWLLLDYACVYIPDQ